MLLAKFSAVKQEAAEEARGRAAAEAELVDLQVRYHVCLQQPVSALKLLQDIPCPS